MPLSLDHRACPDIAFAGLTGLLRISACDVVFGRPYQSGSVGMPGMAKNIGGKSSRIVLYQLRQAIPTFFFCEPQPANLESILNTMIVLLKSLAVSV